MPPSAPERVPLIDSSRRQRSDRVCLDCAHHGAEDAGELFTVDDAVSCLGVGWFQGLMMMVVGFCAVGEGANATVAAFVAPA
eukprot:evm.model.scf_1830.1 EVM.evm.TU.scf_1830.1   scf_1830:4304-4546(-)